MNPLKYIPILGAFLAGTPLAAQATVTPTDNTEHTIVDTSEEKSTLTNKTAKLEAEYQQKANDLKTEERALKLWNEYFLRNDLRKVNEIELEVESRIQLGNENNWYQKFLQSTQPSENLGELEIRLLERLDRMNETEEDIAAQAKAQNWNEPFDAGIKSKLERNRQITSNNAKDLLSVMQNEIELIKTNYNLTKKQEANLAEIKMELTQAERAFLPKKANYALNTKSTEKLIDILNRFSGYQLNSRLLIEDPENPTLVGIRMQAVQEKTDRDIAYKQILLEEDKNFLIDLYELGGVINTPQDDLISTRLLEQKRIKTIDIEIDNGKGTTDSLALHVPAEYSLEQALAQARTAATNAGFKPYILPTVAISETVDEGSKGLTNQITTITERAQPRSMEIDGIKVTENPTLERGLTLNPNAVENSFLLHGQEMIDPLVDSFNMDEHLEKGISLYDLAATLGKTFPDALNTEGQNPYGQTTNRKIRKTLFGVEENRLTIATALGDIDFVYEGTANRRTNNIARESIYDKKIILPKLSEEEIKRGRDLIASKNTPEVERDLIATVLGATLEHQNQLYYTDISDLVAANLSESSQNNPWNISTQAEGRKTDALETYRTTGGLAEGVTSEELNTYVAGEISEGRNVGRFRMAALTEDQKRFVYETTLNHTAREGIGILAEKGIDMSATSFYTQKRKAVKELNGIIEHKAYTPTIEMFNPTGLGPRIRH